MKNAFPFFCDDAGHMALDNRNAFLAYVREHFTGKEGVVVVRSRTALRSEEANAYYWSVVVKAAVDETKQDANAIHAFWCDQFLPNEHKQVEFFNRFSGDKIQIDVDTRRTSKQNGTAFYEYVENCRLWLQEFLGVTTPDPDPEYWRKRPRKDAA